MSPEKGSSWATKSKSSKTNKIEVLRELEQLSQKITAMEREKSTHLYNKRSDFRKEYCPLEEMEMKLNTERKAEKTKLKQQLNRMRGVVDRFQKELQNVKPTPEFVEKLKVMMEDVESHINTFKEHQKTIYEELMRDEKICCQELTALEKRFESWSQVASAPVVKTKVSTTTKNRSSSTTSNAAQNLPPDVIAFERFLQQNGGHRGEWDEYDHQTFLKIRGRYKGKSTFIDAAVNELPIRSVSDITQHEGWYQQYITFLDKKKEAIEKWRLHKEVKRDDLLSVVEPEESEENVKKQQSKMKKLEEERKERQSRLNAWKVQKELEKAMEEEKKHEEEFKREKERERERMRQIQVKTKVESYIQQKQVIEEQRILEGEIEKEKKEAERRLYAQQEILRFQERDQKNLNKKIIKEKQKKLAAQEKEQRLHRLKETVAVNVDRDPTRLYRMTKGWEERTKEPRPTGNSRVLHIPHRAVPSWRSGL
ncbi:coiled-coil domain-containing protein 112-like isoform X2 [Anneissia japonica]|nr:coiled-coil domain-containing protein 112-like isoform X2 [Anneissia japonica]XP_033115297.1 coiled-coil domain-containing protein 112-like isoform X2 [Anneissia japonica]